MATKKAKSKLQLKTVTYAQLKNTGNYENERVEATAVIGDDEDPKEVLRQLKRFVTQSLGDKKPCGCSCCDECLYS